MIFEKRVLDLNFDGVRSKVIVDVVPKWFEGIGLMFKKKGYPRKLLFDFGCDCRDPIHSLFCFFPFYCVWIDEHMNVVDVRRVGPFRFFIRSKKPSRFLLELPINDFNSDIIDFIDEKVVKS